MFAKRPQSGADSAQASAGGSILAHPLIGVVGAGLLFLFAVVALVMVTGDPRAGAPRVRLSLTHPGFPGFSPFGAENAAAPALATTGPAQPLPPAPLAGLTEPGPGGLLPIIGSDGRTPADAYARPFAASGAPKVALVVSGLGLNAAATRQAIEQLPPEVTLAFVPYTDGLQGWVDLARANGHEVLMEMPMEPVDYPQNDPGPYTLMAQDPAQETVKRLEWLLSRATGYFGVTNDLGGRFLASDTAMTAFSNALRRRGLAFVDDGAASGKGGGLPRATAERLIDQTLDKAAIDQQLADLEASAQQHGAALAAAGVHPVTISEVQRWAAGLNARGLRLAPASALTAQR